MTPVPPNPDVILLREVVAPVGREGRDQLFRLGVGEIVRVQSNQCLACDIVDNPRLGLTFRATPLHVAVQGFTPCGRA